MNRACLCLCHDGADGEALRSRHLEAHLAYIESIMDSVRVAGAMRDAEGRIIGSCLIYAADNEAAALELLHGDPYYIGGVWEQVECRTMMLAAGTWIGGKSW